MDRNYFSNDLQKMAENQIRNGNDISKNNEFRNTLKLLYTR